MPFALTAVICLNKGQGHFTTQYTQWQKNVGVRFSYTFQDRAQLKDDEFFSGYFALFGPQLARGRESIDCEPA